MMASMIAALIALSLYTIALGLLAYGTIKLWLVISTYLLTPDRAKTSEDVLLDYWAIPLRDLLLIRTHLKTTRGTSRMNKTFPQPLEIDLTATLDKSKL
jgi:hypothetical protein